MDKKVFKELKEEISTLEQAGLSKPEFIVEQGIFSHQIKDGFIVSMCDNDYLGLSQNKHSKQQAKQALDEYGFAPSSDRPLLGTSQIHKQLEKELASFIGAEDCMLYNSSYDANIGLFEPLLKETDSVFCDGYANPGMIDGIRLCDAEKFCYQHRSNSDLEDKIRRTENARIRMICTDSVFYQTGQLAKLSDLAGLAEQYGAMLMIDDSHGVGLLGERGQGACTHLSVEGRVDLIVGSLSKAFGVGTGGFIAGKKPIISWLRQKSRPYLFSNPMTIISAYTALTNLEIIRSDDSPIPKLLDNTQYLRRGLIKNGFTVLDSPHPIVSVLTREAVATQKFCDAIIKEGIFVVGYCYPVVPKGQAMIRLQTTSNHTKAAIDKVVKTFAKVAKELKVLYVPSGAKRDY